jgi:hypothetical protein
MDYADYKFTVKEFDSPDGIADAPTALMCEPRTRELSIVGNNGYLSIHLKDGITVAKAQEVAAYLEEHIKVFAYVKLRGG